MWIDQVWYWKISVLTFHCFFILGYCVSIPGWKRNCDFYTSIPPTPPPPPKKNLTLWFWASLLKMKSKFGLAPLEALDDVKYKSKITITEQPNSKAWSKSQFSLFTIVILPCLLIWLFFNCHLPLYFTPSSASTRTSPHLFSFFKKEARNHNCTSIQWHKHNSLFLFLYSESVSRIVPILFVFHEFWMHIVCSILR